jgi:RNase P/RNase MRP subunit POP5
VCADAVGLCHCNTLCYTVFTYCLYSICRVGSDGRTIVRVPHEKTDEERAMLPWYRKVSGVRVTLLSQDYIDVAKEQLHTVHCSL